MQTLPLIIQPDPEEPGAAEIYVDGRLDGQPYRFLLDTGAAHSTVVYDAFTSPYARVGVSQSSGVFAPTEDDLIQVASLEVGPIQVQNIVLRRSPAISRPISGLIGMDVLQGYCCHFQFSAARVRVQAGGCEAIVSSNQLITDEKFHPYIPVQVGDVTAQTVWDTGASLTVADTNFIQHHPAFFREAAPSSGTDATGMRVETPMYVMAESVIGGHTFAAHKVAGVDLSRVNATLEKPMDMILGYNLLSQAEWVFDFPRKRWGTIEKK